MQQQAVVNAPEYQFERMKPQTIDEVHWLGRIFSCLKKEKRNERIRSDHQKAGFPPPPSGFRPDGVQHADRHFKMDYGDSQRFLYLHESPDDLFIQPDFRLDRAVFLVQPVWFFELLRRKKPIGLKWAADDVSLSGKTAVLMPIYNEEPVKVYANLLAMAQELDQTGQGSHFDIFVLSDTTNPKTWVKEEKMWLETQRRMPRNIHLYYRRRVQNTARKSGNIEDFCKKWGRLYDFMIVLDADSLLAGRTMLKMAQLMQVNTDTGIIQAPPMCINRNSLFARIQQFAGKVYGSVVAAGSAYWQDGESNYWGHNAIIRVKAFMDCCKLPVLTGKAPFGGHILSHDFVEASLICRGGWRTWLLPELNGSYEECPPSMIDFAIRDRRWCQGNLQHIKVLLSRNLNPVSRIHFLIGIMSYVSSPLWLCFLLVGIAAALGKALIPPNYFPVGYSLFPTWPVFDKVGTVSLFLLSMFMLVFPKFLGLIVYIAQNRRKDIDGIFSAVKSVAAEILFSALTAPVMMMFQSKFVFDILFGSSVGWNPQNRDETGTPWKTAAKVHFWHTLLGLVTTVVVWKYVNVLFWWVLPVTIGLTFSIPVSVLSSREESGLKAKKHKYFIIPEELNVPSVLQKRSITCPNCSNMPYMNRALLTLSAIPT